MSSIEIGAPRPVSAVQVTTVGTTTVGRGGKPVVAETTAETPKAPVAIDAAPQVETSEAVKAGAAPVDAERIATIRHAVETGTYPVFPAKIADAMIAAGMLLRSPK